MQLLASELRHAITSHFEPLAHDLSITRALWAASKSVERGEFRAMIENAGLNNHMAGTLGMGYIKRVQQAELALFLDQTRADEAPQFTLKHTSAAPELSIVKFIEPYAANAGIVGFDLGQEPASQAACERAMLTGEVAMTPLIALEERTPTRSGVRLFLAVYKNQSSLKTPEERRAALLGWTYLALETSEIFSELDNLHPELDFTITDLINDTAQSTLYTTATKPLAPHIPHQSIPINIGEHEWTLTFTPNAAFSATPRNTIYVIALGGPLITLLLVSWLFSLLRTNLKANELAARMTAELSTAVSKAERLALVATHTSNAIILTDAQRITTWVNEGFTRITGYSAEEAIGTNTGKLLQSPLTIPEDIHAIRSALNAGRGFKGEILNRNKSGEDYWVSLEIVPLYDAQGTLTGFMAIEQDITERKASELRLKLATRAGQNGIFDWKLKTNQLHWDETSVEIFGLPAGTMVDSYKQWAQTIHPNDLPRLEGEISDALAGTRSYDTEFRIYWPDRSLHYVRALASVISDESRNPIQMVGVQWDITAAKLDNERLQILSRAVEQSSSSVVITNAQNEIEFVNKTFEQTTGYTRAEAVGHNPRILKSGKVTEKSYAKMWAVLKAGRSWSGVFHNKKKTGEEYVESATITPIKSDSGRITHYLAIKEDITERRALEASIAHERRLLNCLMDTVPVMIYFKDLESRFIRVNQAYEEYIGISQQDLVGMSDVDLFQAKDAEYRNADELKIIATGKPMLNNIELCTHQNGKQYWFSTNKMPLYDAEGAIIGTFSLSIDITEQKRTEAERSNLQIQLIHAQKLESVGMLASGIAHEINTPSQFVTDNISYVTKSITSLDPVLVAYPRLLEALNSNGPLAPEVAEWLTALPKVNIKFLREELPAALKDAHDGMHRITEIVRAMKSFSHPSSDKASPAELNQAITNTLIVCRNEWKYVATTKTHLDPDLPLVPCHLGDFNQVIVNLVVNAAHAIADVVAKAPETKGVITVSTQLLKDWVEIRVADTGTGIPEKARPHLFTPFFTTKTVGKGSGQGLALAHSIIIDRHKGTLHFETELGRGTTFIIRIPLTAPESETGPTATTSNSEPNTEAST